MTEIGEHFAIGAVTVWKVCQLLAITRKKVIYCERNEQIRLQFQEEIASLESKSLVCLDENGVEASSTVRMAELLGAPK